MMSVGGMILTGLAVTAVIAIVVILWIMKMIQEDFEKQMRHY